MPRAQPASDAQAYDAARGKTAFTRLRSRLDALSASELATTSADIVAAIIVALGVADRVGRGPLFSRFKSLPKAEFDVALVKDLPGVAWATWHAATEADKARGGSEAKLPASLVQRAAAIEGRMQQCCEYYFSDDPELGPEVARLRPGTSYPDLAGDLLGYAQIYRDRHDVVKHDKKHYRSTDLADAEKAAEAIVKALGEAVGPDGRTATQNLARAWTLLLRTYGEVSAAGRWLERAEKNVEQLYPSLFSAGRAGSGRPKKKPKPPGSPEGTGGG